VVRETAHTDGGTRTTRAFEHPTDPGRGVRAVAWTDSSAWDAFVESAADGTIAHRWAWGDVVRETYGHRTEYVAAVDAADRIRGVLPLVIVRSRLFGRHVVSMPYLDYGGLCSGRDKDVDAVLLEAALTIAEEERAVLQLRHRGPRHLDLPASLEKVTMLLELGDEETTWQRLPSKRRGQIRKGRRHGLTVTLDGPQQLRDFYHVLSENMRDLGSPLHPIRFFESILRNLHDRAGILVVRDGDVAVGTGLVILDRNTISVPWSSSLRSRFAQAPNQVLYWEAMRYGIQRGAHLFDFGRSSVDSGTFVAKREWGAEPLELHWHHAPADRAPPDDDVRRMNWATSVWRRLPVRVTSVVGPWIRGGIIN
jgi:FemAB-related protein (PEP-CTERM system-associated)